MRIPKTNFTSGELSPKLLGRTDLAKFANGCEMLKNAIVMPQGGAFRRSGFEYITTTKAGGATRLIPFEFSKTQAYILEFGNLYIRFYMDGGQIESAPGVPYEIVSPYATADLEVIKFAQSADVLYLVHPDYQPRKLSRTAHAAWTLSIINFRPPALAVQSVYPDTTLTPGAVTGTNIAFTAGVATFLSGDVGRQLLSGAGRAVITSFTSTTVVKCDIIDDFASVAAIPTGLWRMYGTSSGGITPDIKEPVGAAVVLTSSGEAETRTSICDMGATYDWILSGSGTNEYYCRAAGGGDPGLVEPDRVYEDDILMFNGTMGSLGLQQWDWGDNDALGFNTIYVRLLDETDPDVKAPGWLESVDVAAAGDVFRATDVGKYVTINGGLVKIAFYTSPTSVRGEIRRVLSAITEDTAWTLQSAVWDEANGYPSCIDFFEARLAFAGSTGYPQTHWLSVVDDFENMSPGDEDDNAMSFTLTKLNIIYWLVGGQVLFSGTSGGIARLGSMLIDEPLTPSNVNSRPESAYGSANVQAIMIGDSIVFVQRHGRILRELKKSLTDSLSDVYIANDLSILSDHITGTGIRCMALQRDPANILWLVREDGILVSMTKEREHGVVAWTRHETGASGLFESVAVIPGTLGDELWAVVNRTIGGATVRYIERMKPLFDDTDTEDAFFVDSGLTYDGAAATLISGLDHLEGEDVDVLADGAVIPNMAVSGGDITLPFAATKVHAGLNFVTDIVPVKVELTSVTDTLQGKTKRISEITLRLYRSLGLKAGPDASHLEIIPFRRAGDDMGAQDTFTGDVSMPYPGDYGREGSVMIRQDNPLPLSLLAILYKLEVEED